MNSNPLLLVTVLIAALFALIISLKAFLNSRKSLNQSREKMIETIAKREVTNYLLLNYNQRIRDIVHEEIVRELRKKEEPKMEMTKPTASADVPPKVVEKPVETADSHMTEQRNVGTVLTRKIEMEKNPNEISLPEPVTFYTGICKDNTFRHVTSFPDNKTIYTINVANINANEGILDVEASAFEKIAQTPDYLQNACIYSGNGSRLIIIKTGRVVKLEGTWIVKEPIQAEFN